MRLHGYTADKAVVKARLPVRKVIQAGINPFGLDLFDPDPITLKFKGHGTLFFSRLRDACFGIHDAVNQKSWWAVRTGGKVCLMEGSAPVRDRLLRHSLKELDEKEFPRRLAEYLALFDKSDRRSRSRQTDEALLDFNEEGRVFLDGTRLQYGDLVVNVPRFQGEMFAKLPVFIELPESINWVFGAFSPWKPMVFGGCLRDTIRGAEFKDVDFMVDQQDVAAYTKHLRKLGATDIKDITGPYMDNGSDQGVVLEFRFGGVAYNLVSRTESTRDFWSINDFSVNQMYALAPNQVTASAIALHDLGNKQVRVVSSLRPLGWDQLHRRWCRRAYALTERGFQFLQTDFVPITPVSPELETREAEFDDEED